MSRCTVRSTVFNIRCVLFGYLEVCWFASTAARHLHFAPPCLPLLRASPLMTWWKDSIPAMARNLMSRWSHFSPLEIPNGVHFVSVDDAVDRHNLCRHTTAAYAARNHQQELRVQITEPTARDLGCSSRTWCPRLHRTSQTRLMWLMHPPLTQPQTGRQVGRGVPADGRSACVVVRRSL